MTRIPHEASERRPFTPPSLANLPSPPIFTIKAATRREKRKHGRLIVEEGLNHHSQAALRAEMLRALEQMWSPDLFAENEPKLREYWHALDDYTKAAKETSDEDAAPAPFDHPLRDEVDDLVDRIVNAWPQLRIMAADNIEFSQESPALMACCVVAGWKNLDVQFALEGGFIPIERMQDISEFLGDLEKEHAGKVEGVGAPGTAFAQLCLEAVRALYLSEGEAKNSDSPSPTTSIPSISNGAATADTSSKDKPTPAIPAT